MLQYARFEHLLDAGAERLLLRPLEQHPEAHARPLGRSRRAAPTPCATDRAARGCAHRAAPAPPPSPSSGSPDRDRCWRRRRCRAAPPPARTSGRSPAPSSATKSPRRSGRAHTPPTRRRSEARIARAPLHRLAEQAGGAGVVAPLSAAQASGAGISWPPASRAPNKVSRKPQHRNRRIARCCRRMMLREARSIPSGMRPESARRLADVITNVAGGWRLRQMSQGGHRPRQAPAEPKPTGGDEPGAGEPANRRMRAS